MSTGDPPAPTLAAIRTTRERLGDRIDATPVREWRDPGLERLLGSGTRVLLKEELFQRTGTFKPRGALTVMLGVGPERLARGITAMSGGNHAMAVAYAARAVGASARVVMPERASPYRIRMCREYGAEVELVADIHRAFARAHEIADQEGRVLIHPFEGPEIALGTATLGLELVEQAGVAIDAVVVPIGGGGLCAGVSAAVKLASPESAVYGVEPEGADSMHRSFAAGAPQRIDAVDTIADSLASPRALPYSFGLCRRFVDELVLVSDDALRSAMKRLFLSAKLAVEPAGAASTAALLGPLRERLSGKTVALVICGSNIDHASFAEHLAAAPGDPESEVGA